MEENRKILKEAELAKVSGGEAEAQANETGKIMKKRGSKCSVCGSTNVKREQKKHYIVQVTCNDCGYQYKFPGELKEE